MEATATAHANLAFVKYWGKLNYELNIPSNGSISMNLSAATTVTTVKFESGSGEDKISINGVVLNRDSSQARRISNHLDLVRSKAEVDMRARVESENSFPMSAGFASSASGFAALTLASAAALDLKLSEREASILARRGSGSASRSVPSGFVEWLGGNEDSNSYAIQIAPPSHWQICDVAVVVSRAPKHVSSSHGHRLAQTSSLWETRMESVDRRLNAIRSAILARDFTQFGRQTELEAVFLHSIAMTSPYNVGDAWQSGIYYWAPETIELISAVQTWRSKGLEVYFTLDAGPTVHLMCEKDSTSAVVSAVQELMADRSWDIIVSEPAVGAYVNS